LTEGLECISWNQMERLKLDCLTTWWHLDRGIQNWWNVERIHWNHHLISMLTSVMTSICCCIWQKGAEWCKTSCKVLEAWEQIRNWQSISWISLGALSHEVDCKTMTNVWAK
jgi:hypothetical protein